jgi:hypothetical protein
MQRKRNSEEITGRWSMTFTRRQWQWFNGEEGHLFIYDRKASTHAQWNWRAQVIGTASWVSRSRPTDIPPSVSLVPSPSRHSAQARRAMSGISFDGSCLKISSIIRPRPGNGPRHDIQVAGLDSYSNDQHSLSCFLFLPLSVSRVWERVFLSI